MTGSIIKFISLCLTFFSANLLVSINCLSLSINHFGLKIHHPCPKEILQVNIKKSVGQYLYSLFEVLGYLCRKINRVKPTA